MGGWIYVRSIAAAGSPPSLNHVLEIEPVWQ